MWVYISIIYLISEVANYAIYLSTYNYVNNFRNINNSDKSLVMRKVNILKNDMLLHLKNKREQLMDLFNTTEKSNQITYNLSDTIRKTFYYPHHDGITSEHYELVDIFNDIPKDLNYVPHDICESKIMSWYPPVIIKFIMKIVKIHTNYFLEKNNFKKYVCENGLIIWKKDGLNNKKAQIFFHASIGGPAIYKNFIKNLSKNCDTVMLVEIPGISFGNDIIFPATIYSISDNLVTFLINSEIRQIDLIGHSFGCNIVACLINRFYNKLCYNNVQICKTIIVEGLVFIPRLLNIYKLFNENALKTAKDMIMDGRYFDLISIPLFYRDVYLQFYMQRCLTLTDNVLLGDTIYENNNNINIILSGNDDKIIIDDVVYYLASKKYNCTVKIFSGRKHGDFAFDSQMQDHVLDILFK